MTNTDTVTGSIALRTGARRPAMSVHGTVFYQAKGYDEQDGRYGTLAKPEQAATFVADDTALVPAKGYDR